MLPQFLASLSQKDKTLALILALCIGISTVSGVTVYVFKLMEQKQEKSEVKDVATVAGLRAEILQLKIDHKEEVAGLRTENHNQSVEIAELNVKIRTAQTEFLTDLKEQRDIIQGIDKKQLTLSRKVQKVQSVNTKQLDSLKHAILP